MDSEGEDEVADEEISKRRPGETCEELHDTEMSTV